MKFTREESLKRAKVLLKPFYKRLNDSVSLGCGDFLEAATPHSGVYDKTTRANMIQDHILYQLRQSIATDPSILFLGFGKLRMFKFNQDYLFKIKKLDKNHRSKNVKSDRVLRFTNQEPMFENLDQLEHLELGYTLDVTGTVITDVLIVCPKNRQNNLWEISLFDELGKSPSVTLFSGFEIEDDLPDYNLPGIKLKTGKRSPEKENLDTDENDREAI